VVAGAVVAADLPAATTIPESMAAEAEEEVVAAEAGVAAAEEAVTYRPAAEGLPKRIS